MLLLLLLFVCNNIENVLSQDGASRDYCEADTFTAQCPKNQIIFMTSALYGRMKVGSCVKKDLGHIGCYSDVMRQADNRCSGKRTCQVRIPDSEMDLTRPCHEELKTYLEVSYQCIQVNTPKENSCQNEEVHSFVVHITSGVGHISSSLYASSKCSSEAWPIRIIAFQGQRLNITIFDFRHAVIPGNVEVGPPQQWILQNRKGRSSLSNVSVVPTFVTQPSHHHHVTPSHHPLLRHPPPPSSSHPYRAPVWQKNQLRIKRETDPRNHSKKSPSSASHLQHGDADCSFHVVIQDRHAARRIRVCPSQLRQRSVYVSANHSLEIYFKREQIAHRTEGVGGVDDDTDRFLVRYEVIGCEDLKVPDEMWLTKGLDEIDVGCKDSEHKWNLRCLNNKWKGLLGNCSKAALFGISSINEADLNSLPHGMAIVVVMCVALLMGLTVLIIGALGLLLRRFHKKSSRPTYAVPGKQVSGSTTPSQRMLPPNNSNNVMLSSQEFFDYSDPRQQQQQQHYQQQQQQQPLQRCVGCNAALADYYATLTHRRCIIPQCEDSFPVDVVSSSAETGTILSNALHPGTNEMSDGTMERLSDYSKYPGQQFNEVDYHCTMAGGVCTSKFELGPHFSTSSMWKQQKKPNYCPVLDDKTFSRLENLHGCT